MPPNLGGFFMVRSYYPSECHADYFDFERIEALKPAIEACGISTLSQSPMLGFHKQMDNRIKLLEDLSKQQQVSEIMRQMLTQAQTAGQYFTNDQIKEMTRKVSAEVDLVHQQTQNQRYGSSHI